MDKHKLLLRQLSRLAIDYDHPPTDIKKWNEFLERINKSYYEADQERYLLERSFEISSRELNELNTKLEEAQHIAKLGYWLYDKSEEKITWSKEIFDLLGFDPTDSAPSYNEIMRRIHEKDRPKLQALIDNAFDKNEDYEMEIRIGSNDDYKWFYVLGHPIIEENNQIKKLQGILMDINKRKKIEEEIERLHKELFDAARNAGMAEVATSILHNIGNVLNSVNVSIGLMQEIIQQDEFDKLSAICEMFQENSENINNYLTLDSKGKLIPKYLVKLIKNIKEDHEVITKEVNMLRSHVDHIHDITKMQKSLSGVSNLPENISVKDVIEYALKMSFDSYQNKNIQLNKSIDDDVQINTDKAKLLQILVNLFQNAMDALMQEQNNIKKMSLVVSLKKTADGIEIIVKDNGIGIVHENLTKIFSFGFTTKKNGHGFGLHSSALAAKELGGKLEAQSEGIGFGTTFILTLPLILPSKEGVKHHDKTEKEKITDHHY